MRAGDQGRQSRIVFTFKLHEDAPGSEPHCAREADPITSRGRVS